MNPVDLIKAMEERAEEQGEETKHQQLVKLLTEINENLKKLQKPTESDTIQPGENK